MGFKSCHRLHTTRRPQSLFAGWRSCDVARRWSTDLLYIAITNSGLSATTVFTRTSKGRRSLSVGAYVLMAATILLLVIAAIVYGLRASGHAQQMNMTLVAAPILFGSALVSMYFEVVLALSYQGSTRRSR